MSFFYLQIFLLFNFLSKISLLTAAHTIFISTSICRQYLIKIYPILEGLYFQVEISYTAQNNSLICQKWRHFLGY